MQLKKCYWVLCALPQNDSTAACVLIGGEMFVTSIERSWLLYLCNSLDQDHTSWPEEGGPELAEIPGRMLKGRCLYITYMFLNLYHPKTGDLLVFQVEKNLKLFSLGFFYL